MGVSNTVSVFSDGDVK